MIETENADSGEWEVGPGEAVLPDALEKVGAGVFGDCSEIKTIWVGNSSAADSMNIGYHAMAILPAR